MVAAVLTPTEDQTFDALFGWIAKVLDLPDNTQQIVKGFQNLTAAPTGSYIVISPGILQRQDFARRRFAPGPNPDTATGQIVQLAHNTYSYQIDCYGADGPTWASILAVAWRTPWGVDNMAAGAITPLHADAPQQLNIINSEGQFEQRFMIRLFGQVNQEVTLPQDYFTQVDIDTIATADRIP